MIKRSIYLFLDPTKRFGKQISKPIVAANVSPNLNDFQIGYKSPPDLREVASGKASCPGCGAHFQVAHEKEQGYIPPRAVSAMLEDENRRAEGRKKMEVVDTIFQTMQKEFKSSGLASSSHARLLFGKKQTEKEQDNLNSKHQKEKTAELLRSPEEVREAGVNAPPTILCQRCRTITRYHKQNDVPIEHFIESFGKLRRKQALFVKVVDIFNLNGTFIENVEYIVGNNPMILAVTKLDLLPKKYVVPKLAQIEAQTRHIALHNFGVKNLKEVVAVSAKKGLNVKRLAAAISQHRGPRDVYLIGAANAGKSSLINALLKKYMQAPTKGGAKQRLLPRATVSQRPGTTLQPIPFRLVDGGCLYDTPGVMQPFRTDHAFKLKPRLYLPRDPIQKPWVFLVKPGTSVLVSSLVRFDLLSGPARGVKVVVFANRQLGATATKTIKAKQGYAVRNSGDKQGAMLRPKIDSPEVVSQSHQFEMEMLRAKHTAEDLAVANIGWISICADVKCDLKWEVHSPEGFVVRRRPALLQIPTTDLKSVKPHVLYLRRRLKPAASGRPGPATDPSPPEQGSAPHGVASPQAPAPCPTPSPTTRPSRRKKSRASGESPGNPRRLAVAAPQPPIPPSQPRSSLPGDAGQTGSPQRSLSAHPVGPRPTSAKGKRRAVVVRAKPKLRRRATAKPKRSVTRPLGPRGRPKPPHDQNVPN